MFNDFLSSLLKIVIVLDVVGLVAWFVLGAVRPRRLQGAAGAPLAPDQPPVDRRPWWGWARPFSFTRLRPSLGRWMRPRNPSPVASGDGIEAAFARLHRVLNSYGEGLT